MIGYLVKKLEEKDRCKQIGNTRIQKMIYLLTRKSKIDFDYSMHYYGPYSNEVSGDLSFAEGIDIIDKTWNPDRGYFITSKPELNKFIEKYLSEEEKRAVGEAVDQFGDFIAKELSIIATAFYLKDKYGFSDKGIVKIVHHFKGDYTIEYINKLLKKAGVIN